MDLREQLEVAQMPSSLVPVAMKGIPPEDLKDQYDSLLEFLREDPEKRVMILTGNDSPQKDQFIACLMRWYMVTRKRTGLWLPPPRDYLDSEIGRQGITAVLAVDLYPDKYAPGLASVFREWVPNGRAFAISVSSEPALKEVIGSSLVTYLYANALVLDLTVSEATPVRIE